ncbi:sulfur oxidation c-type cytochrome SoxX [Phreatobacter sp. AB_2022a]|uniref:sulfur oxidation c-type cytochrome SoxX n=1 Tax=Phreatobacter sp. AB_2022a TaxID=3003134 RepID=UPI00228764D7|nr:sulfur oxidation c-type cytochrome SoxX [Phreatobacter sp. AB_2022a]MCZ0734919.1 sulfur oxidation c-type cytochrome SoxX [Phreatobacter sp. AB_2022a]
MTRSSKGMLPGRSLASAFALTLVLAAPALAQSQPAAPAAAEPLPQVGAQRVEEVIRSTFTRAPAEWRARVELDETQRMCTERRNQVSGAEADAIQARERARVVLPPDGRFLGDWRRGLAVANSGRGGQFSDAANTVSGGNCYACHQMDPKELSFGTLGPSLAGYGRDRNYDPELIREAYIKIYNSQAVVACSNMPRFGATHFLSMDQIRDVLAYLFDKDSPVNK